MAFNSVQTRREFDVDLLSNQSLVIMSKCLEVTSGSDSDGGPNCSQGERSCYDGVDSRRELTRDLEKTTSPSGGTNQSLSIFPEIASMENHPLLNSLV